MSLHEMVVKTCRDTGTEEWCPRCGRRLLLRWPPRYERVVLHPGDDQVVHVGGRAEAASLTAITEFEKLWLSEIGIVWD
ncbi:hypothetical protein [Actinoplanes sp. TFC3]|uniref:hypothetical protein n=1 Tax=Actinoplanes sp. TFC3 TaxID=1710355 RepID=UPI00082CB016|nr:hypothetical protein [Actinoplanes sp. TFC3]